MAFLFKIRRRTKKNFEAQFIPVTFITKNTYELKTFQTEVWAIAEMTSDIQHVDGKKNIVADALSRLDGIPNSMAAALAGSATISDEESMHPLVLFQYVPAAKEPKHLNQQTITMSVNKPAMP